MYLAETLSFKRTADYFYVSRSVISRHIASIEGTLGVKLLERGNQSVRLTEAGKVFHREVQTVLRVYANAVENAREAGNVKGTVVRIGYLKNAARPVIVRFVRYMHDEHPDIRLDATCMEYSELRRAIDEGSVDVALGVNVDPRVSHNYRSTQIYTDRLFAVMGKDHPLASRANGVDIAELSEYKLLLPDSFVFSNLAKLVDEHARPNMRVVAREYYQDVDLLYLKVQAEGYVAFSSGLNNAMFGGQLAILPITGADTTFSVSAFYVEDLPGDVYRMLSKAFEWCRDTMGDVDALEDGPLVGLSFA